MTKIIFTKMHGLGNDFILIDRKSFSGDIDYSDLSKKMCDRHFGIGADGLIIVNPEISDDNTDTAWRIFNSDGSEPEMCGNGIRCFAKYIYDNKIINKDKFTVATLAGVITPSIEPDGMVTVDMGAPIFEHRKIPVNIIAEKVINYTMKVFGEDLKINCVSMGNPHCIIFPETELDIFKYGPTLETHILFPQKTNVELVKVLSRDHIKVDVWERGCGITLACGTGACASVVAAYLNNLTDRKAKVTLPGGDLVINYDEATGHVFMSGPAEYICTGEFYL